MKPVKQTFGSLFLVAVLVISLFGSGFSQTAFAAVTITSKSVIDHAEVYRVVTREKSGGDLEVLDEGPVTSEPAKGIVLDSYARVFFVFFVRPEPGYLITGAGAGGKGNMSHISELRDPAKKGRTETKVPEEILKRMEDEGYIIAWGYTRFLDPDPGKGNTGNIVDTVDGYKPVVNSTITNTTGDLEAGKPITMKVVIKPVSPFRISGDNRKYSTEIPEDGVNVTIDDNKIIPVTGIVKKNNNEYTGIISFELDEDDARVNTHKAVVNAKVIYTAEVSNNSGAYAAAVPTRSTTVVEAKPATVNFSLVTNTNRKLTYDLGYEGAETFPVETYNSGATVTVKSGSYERAESEFGGWFMTNNAGEVVTLQPSQTFSMPDRVTGTRLLAKWNSMLTVDNDNGTAVTKDIRESGSTVTPAKPTKIRHEFLGWKDSDGKTYGVDDEIIMPNKPMKLLAMWYNPSPSYTAVIPSASSTPNKLIYSDDGIDNGEDNNVAIKKEATVNKADKKNTSGEKSGKKTSTENKANKKDSSDNKTAKKNSAESKADKKNSESKSDKKAAESKSDKKAAESKSEKKVSESKSDKKAAESKSEEKTSGSKSDKKASEIKVENKTEKKSSESKSENKIPSGSKSDKKASESKLENKTEKKASESKDEKKSPEGKSEKGTANVNKKVEVGTETENEKEDTLDTTLEELEAQDEADITKNHENEETSEEKAAEEEADTEESKKETKKKEDANKEKDKNNSDSKSEKKEATDKEAGKKDSSSSDSGKNGSSSFESGKNTGLASQTAKEKISVIAAGRGGAGIIDPKTGLPRDSVKGTESSIETNKTHAFGVGQDQGFEILLYDEQGIPLYGNKAGVLIYRGKVLKNSNMLKNGKILKNGKLLVDGKVFTIAAKTLPVTGGRVNVEFWLGLSILSALGVYMLLEAKRKKAK